MTLNEILPALGTLSEQDLRDLNTSVVAQLKVKRKIATLQNSVLIQVGKEYILQGISPKYLNGTKVRVEGRGKGGTRFVCVNATTGAFVGSVPSACLKAI